MPQPAGGRGESRFRGKVSLSRTPLCQILLKSSKGGRAEGREFPTVPKCRGMNSQPLRAGSWCPCDQSSCSSSGSEPKPQNKEQNSQQLIKEDFFFFHFMRMLSVSSAGAVDEIPAETSLKIGIGHRERQSGRQSWSLLPSRCCLRGRAMALAPNPGMHEAGQG